jgi:hypothetical protein
VVLLEVELKLPPIPEIILHIPVSPIAGALAARLADELVRIIWSEPAFAFVEAQLKEILTVSVEMPQIPDIVQTKVYTVSDPLFKIADGLFEFTILAPFPEMIVHVPVSPAAGALAARVAVAPDGTNWSGPAEEVEGAQLSLMHRAEIP